MTRPRLAPLLLAACLFPAADARAAEALCPGSPFVNAFRPRSIENTSGVAVGPQIFDIAAHPRGFVLLANNYGLLAYDGSSFRLTRIGHAGTIFSLAVSPGGQIYAGGPRTFGEIVEDPSGDFLYRAFDDGMPADQAFSDVWQTFAAPDGTAYFRAPERVFVEKAGSVVGIPAKGRFTAAVLLRGILHVNDSGRGLVQIEGPRTSDIPGGEALRSLHVTALAEGEPGSLLVGTQDQGLFRFDLRSHELVALDQPSAMRAAEILSVRRLADGSIAVGTLRAGIFLLSPRGALLNHIDRTRGLPDDAVLALQISNGSLWAGTNGGVAQVLSPSPVQSYGDREGLPGIVESLVHHQGSVWAATSQGVFRLACGGRAFEAVPGLGKQAFSLYAGDTLLAATSDGIFEIRGGAARLVRPGRARSFAMSQVKDRLWAATQSGVAVLTRRGGAWGSGDPVGAPDQIAGEPVAGVEATSLGEDGNGRLWVALTTGRMLSAIPKAQSKGVRLDEVKVLSDREGITPGFVEVINLKDGVHVGLVDSVLAVTAAGLTPDPPLTEALGKGRGAFRIVDSADGGYWVASEKRPVRLIPSGAAGSLRVQPTALLRTPAGSRILDFLEVSPTEVWIGTDEGAIRYDPSMEPREATAEAALIRGVWSNQTRLFSGGKATGLDAALPHLSALRFEVASSSLDDPSRTSFRFRLDGQDAEWSPWTAETRKDYTNLGSGRYRFRVQSRDVYGRVGEEAGLAFTVLRPWYRQTWAIALFALAGFGLFFGALQMRTRALRLRQMELEALVAQKTAELREASFTDPLTGLRNRRYFGEVIGAEASLAARPGSPALHFFLVDLDHFKQVNDTFGHAAGDEVLRQTAKRLRSAMRTSDLIFRWGGEEFLVVARGTADLPRHELARRIVSVMANLPFDIGNDMRIARTCSVGFATYPFATASPALVPVDAVIELADLALYRAKQTGRNRAIGVSPRAGDLGGAELRVDVLQSLEEATVALEVIEGPGSLATV